MMDKHTEQEIEKTLESLDGIKRLQAKPYFYTRLQIRLDRSEANPFHWRWAVAGILLILALNTVAYIKFWPRSTADEYAMDQMAVEYNLEWPSLYSDVDE